MRHHTFREKPAGAASARSRSAAHWAERRPLEALETVARNVQAVGRLVTGEEGVLIGHEIAKSERQLEHVVAADS